MYRNGMHLRTHYFAGLWPLNHGCPIIEQPTITMELEDCPATRGPGAFVALVVWCRKYVGSEYRTWSVRNTTPYSM